MGGLKNAKLSSSSLQTILWPCNQIKIPFWGMNLSLWRLKLYFTLDYTYCISWTASRYLRNVSKGHVIDKCPPEWAILFNPYHATFPAITRPSREHLFQSVVLRLSILIFLWANYSEEQCGSLRRSHPFLGLSLKATSSYFLAVFSGFLPWTGSCDLLWWNDTCFEKRIHLLIEWCCSILISFGSRGRLTIG
jgi:hypothetical protein